MPQTYAGNATQQKTFYNRTLLSRLLPKLVFMQHGQKKPIPKHEGSTVNFRRFNSLAIASTPLVEGVTPAEANPTIAVVNATVQGYGNYVFITDFLDMVGIDPVVTEWMEVMGENAAETLDTVIRDVVAAGTNVLYVGGGPARINVAAANIIDGVSIRTARKIMARNNVKPLDGNAYIGFVHPDTSFDIMGDSAWINANQYAGSTKIFEGELGRLHGIRFIETTLAPVFAGLGAGGCDVYGSLVIGKDAYGVPDIAGSSKPESIVKSLGSAGTSDPLNQRSSVGYKAYLATVRLQELAILRIEHAVSV